MGDNSSEKKRFIFLYDCQTEGHNVPALLKFLIIFFFKNNSRQCRISFKLGWWALMLVVYPFSSVEAYSFQHPVNLNISIFCLNLVYHALTFNITDVTFLLAWNKC